MKFWNDEPFFDFYWRLYTCALQLALWEGMDIFIYLSTYHNFKDEPESRAATNHWLRTTKRQREDKSGSIFGYRLGVFLKDVSRFGNCQWH